MIYTLIDGCGDEIQLEKGKRSTKKWTMHLILQLRCWRQI